MVKTSFDNEIKTIQKLINYGINESKETPTVASSVEYQTLGADGKTYGIVREGLNYYLKVAPKKDTKVLAEDFDYVGGFMNKSNCGYSSYNKASKQLELKLASINEAYETNRVVSTEPETTSSEWQITETKEMRNELNRFNQLVNNVDKILSEGSGYVVMNQSVPEAPASNPSDKKVNKPYDVDAKPLGDKDMKETSSDHEKVAPFEEDGNPSENGEPKKGDGKDKTYSEKPQYVETGVAGTKPSGGKVVKVNEGKTIKLTEEQVLAWGESEDFIDKSKGTKIGDSAPYSCDEDEKCANVNEAVDDDFIDDDFEGVENEELEDVPFPEIEKEDPEVLRAKSEQDYQDLLRSIRNGDFEDDSYSDDYDYYGESKMRRKNQIKESSITLSDFGKHPAFRKVPMTTPPNTDPDPKKYGRDWNDKSAKSNEPFAKKIGSSAPYSEEVVDMLTDAVMSKLFNKKKV